MTSLVKARARRAELEEEQVRAASSRAPSSSSSCATATRRRSATWNDLVKPGVEVVTPNVQTSGGAKWNVMAAYGAQLRRSARRTRRRSSTSRKLYKHVVSQDKSAREALQTFLAGRGDVLLAYENEAIFAPEADQPVHVRDPEGDDPDREPDRRHDDSRRTRRPRTRSSTSCARRRRSRSSRRTATGRSCRQRGEGLQLPGPAAAVHDQVRSAAGRRSTSSSSTRAPGS